MPGTSKYKRLAIFSDCVHLYDPEGNVATENHIFRKQMEALAIQFEQTTIYCPFEEYEHGKVITCYKKNAIAFHPLPNVGGNSLQHKIRLLYTIPIWLKAAGEASRQADIIFQRFPDNLNIPAFFYFYFTKAKVFATYTGTWKNYKGEPLTYRFQKWLLKHFFRGPVFAYTHEIKTGEKIFRSFSPSYTIDEWNEETEQVENRIKRLQANNNFAPVFITVGSLIQKKNQQYILDSFKELQNRGFNFQLYIVGDGPLRNQYQQFIDDNNLQGNVFLTGKKTDTCLRELYRKADFIIQATLTEGFGKVPLEGFFHGAIPLLNNIGLAGEMTGNGVRGFLFSAEKRNDLSNTILSCITHKEQLTRMISDGRVYAESITLESWVDSYLNIINTYFE